MADTDKDDSNAKGSSSNKASGGSKGSGSGTTKQAKTAANKAAAKVEEAAKDARSGAEEVAAEARSAARQVGRDATEAASELAASASEQIQEAAAERKQAAAERVLRIAEAVDRAGGELDREIPFVGDYVHRTADELETVGRAVRDRDVGELVGVAQDFARRQPALFAGVVGLAGFAAVRFVMASAQQSGSGRSGSDRAGSSGDNGGQRLLGSSGSDERSGSGEDEAALREALRDGNSMPSGDPGGVAPKAPDLGLNDLTETGDEADKRAAKGGTTRAGSADNRRAADKSSS